MNDGDRGRDAQNAGSSNNKPGMDAAAFLRRSRDMLARVLDDIGTLGDKNEIRVASDRYTHLLKLQMDAVLPMVQTRHESAEANAQRSAELQERFLREAASCAGARGEVPGAEGAEGEKPSEAQMVEFKRAVNAWYQQDNEERVLKIEANAVRLKIAQSVALKGKIGQSIMTFMERFDIEDLSTRDGVLRFNRREVRRAAGKTQILDRIRDFFTEDEATAEALLGNVLQPLTVEQKSLRRLKPR